MVWLSFVQPFFKSLEIRSATETSKVWGPPASVNLILCWSRITGTEWCHDFFKAFLKHRLALPSLPVLNEPSGKRAVPYRTWLITPAGVLFSLSMSVECLREDSQSGFRQCSTRTEDTIRRTQKFYSLLFMHSDTICDGRNRPQDDQRF